MQSALYKNVQSLDGFFCFPEQFRRGIRDKGRGSPLSVNVCGAGCCRCMEQIRADIVAVSFLSYFLWNLGVLGWLVSPQWQDENTALVPGDVTLCESRTFAVVVKILLTLTPPSKKKNVRVETPRKRGPRDPTHSSNGAEARPASVQGCFRTLGCCAVWQPQVPLKETLPCSLCPSSAGPTSFRKCFIGLANIRGSGWIGL